MRAICELRPVTVRSHIGSRPFLAHSLLDLCGRQVCHTHRCRLVMPAKKGKTHAVYSKACTLRVAKETRPPWRRPKWSKWEFVPVTPPREDPDDDEVCEDDGAFDDEET